MKYSTRFIMALTIFVLFVNSASSQYGGGSGTSADPYQIRTISHLTSISGNLQDLDKHFKLMEDLDLTGIDFSPIGQSSASSFRGMFDGNNHKISNIKIHGVQDATGVFGFAKEKNSNEKAVIKNLTLINVDIKGKDAVGGLVGDTEGVNITGCRVSGKVEGDSYTGGIVGHCAKGEIKNSSCSASVTGGTGAQYVGGFVGVNGRSGFARGADVFQCFSEGNVQAGAGSGLIGGFVGYSRSVKPISQCFASGDVAGGSMVGGFIGKLDQAFDEYGIEDCYARGAVSGHAVGGFIGVFDPGAAIKNCYSTGLVTPAGEYAYGGFDGTIEGNIPDTINSFWDIDTSGQTKSVSGRGYHTPEMQQQNTFTGWDFVDIWTIQEGKTYPYFFWQPDPNDPDEPDGPPDMVVSIVGDTNLEVFQEETVEIALSLKNEGETDAVPESRNFFETMVYISNDRMINWDQLSRATYAPLQLAQLGAGQQYSASMQVVAPSEPGIWYLRVKIDDWGDVTEADEFNNWTDIATLAVKRPLVADITGDGLVDLEDLLIFIENWLTDNEWADIYPAEGDGIVDLGDFAVLASEWDLTDGVLSDRVPLSSGTFEMGNSSSEGYPDEFPVHTITLSSFYMGRYLITNGQYCEFLNSAQSQGLITVIEGVVYQADFGNRYPYCDTSLASPYSQITYDNGVFGIKTKGGRDMSKDPMVYVSWHGAAAYCNWRSEQAGRQPCYYPYTWICNFGKNGYHLPTEAQWEYAARGGLVGKRYPWGDTISEHNANYCYNPLFKDWLYPYTSPVRSFPPNGYGLYDMAGNVREWCNDWRGTYTSRSNINPTGPGTGTFRAIRGGCWGSSAYFCRVAYRGGYTPDSRYFVLGFRVAVDF